MLYYNGYLLPPGFTCSVQVFGESCLIPSSTVLSGSVDQLCIPGFVYWPEKLESLPVIPLSNAHSINPTCCLLSQFQHTLIINQSINNNNHNDKSHSDVVKITFVKYSGTSI